MRMNKRSLLFNCFDALNFLEPQKQHKHQLQPQFHSPIIPFVSLNSVSWFKLLHFLSQMCWYEMAWTTLDAYIYSHRRKIYKTLLSYILEGLFADRINSFNFVALWTLRYCSTHWPLMKLWFRVCNWNYHLKPCGPSPFLNGILPSFLFTLLSNFFRLGSSKDIILTFGIYTISKCRKKEKKWKNK